MRLDTIIRGGRLVTAAETTRAYVGIRGEKIVAIGNQLAAAHANDASVIGAKGCYVIPGGIDVHVHLELPFCGTSPAYDDGLRSDQWQISVKPPPENTWALLRRVLPGFEMD